MKLFFKKPFVSYILVFISLVSIFFNFFFYNNLKEQNRVTEVVDGDTFQIKSGKRIRLVGVDAPEFDRCGGKEAKARLSELILNKIVNLKEEKTEAYGRSLALVYLGKTLINKIMLEEGWGRTDYKANSQRDILTAAFHKGQKENLGIFSNLCRNGDMSGDCNIKGNIDKNYYEKFYHLPGCLHYDEVIIEKDIGEGYFCTEKEALAAGFNKAAGCE